MTFDFPGYDLTFIQKHPCNDASDHLHTLVYKFFSPVTGYHYILRADYHAEHVFAIKFYCKKDRHSDFKYSRIVNKGDLGNILITCAKVIPILLAEYPNVSFGFAGARTFDIQSKRVESYIRNQRFTVYRYVIAKKIGFTTFAHFEYEEISSYLLVNRNQGDVNLTEKKIVSMFTETYNTLVDII